MNHVKQLSLLALGAAFLSGCGGGGGSSSPTEGTPTGSVNQFGPIETRGQIKGTPIVRDLGKISTVALSGIITDATYRPQGRQDNETGIVAVNAGSMDVHLETGELVEQWMPAKGKPDDYYAYPVWNADGSRLYYATPSGIYYTTPSNPTASTVVISLSSGLNFFTLSPSGTRIAYTRTSPGETDADVFVRDVAGGPTKRLTNNTDVSDFGGAWTDDDHVTVASTDASPDTTITIYNVNDLTTAPFMVGLKGIPIARSADGNLFVMSQPTMDTAGFSLVQKAGPLFGSKDYFTPDYGNLLGASVSPDGSRWAISSSPGGVYTTELAPITRTTVVGARPVQAGVAWQPAMGVTKFLGSSSKLGSSAAGMIATRRTGSGRNGLSSFVSWDCETRSTSTVSDDVTDSGAGSKTYTIEVDRLTSLKYANRPLFNAVSSVSASSTANGAIVTVDGTSGVVTSLVIYQETRGSKPTVKREGENKVVEGHILAVWDAKGKNVSPSGTSRVVLDSTGKPEAG